MSDGSRIAIVGATGAVGAELIALLEEREIAVRSLRLFASPQSSGQKRSFRGEDLPIEILSEDGFAGCDVAFFSAGAGISRTFAPAAAAAGAIVIDNSSAFRMEPNVPLIIPEINAGDLHLSAGIIAVPNCTTIVSLMALYPLHQAFGLRRVIAASYQAVSGAGAKGIHELTRQTSAALAGETSSSSVFPHVIAFNVLPQVDTFDASGFTREELKFVNESRKIMHLPQLKASITCVRVPVYRAHSVALNAEFERPVSVEEARDTLAKAPGLQLMDEPAKNVYPTPLDVAGRHLCGVGRIRLDPALENGLALWVSGDQILKGAALNAVQIFKTWISIAN